MVLGPRGDIVYTRDGSFKISVTENGNMLTTSDGYRCWMSPELK